MASFSTAAENAITRTIDIEPALVHSVYGDLDGYYDIQRTVDEIVAGDYNRIALQFPDELLHDSVPIFKSLKRKLGEASGRQLYVLADTSYGSCCVDEVAASHVDADAIVHYGYACLSQPYRLPVIYVYGKNPLDSESCVEEFLRASAVARGADVLLKHDVAYAHIIDDVVRRLQGHVALKYSPTPMKLDPSAPPKLREIDMEEVPRTIFYIGGESLGLTNLLITHSDATIWSYNPKTKQAREESSRTNKMLMRRYAIVQKARDADVFGILIGTLGVAGYLPLINHLRSILARAHKKTYTISVGKLNPAKLANFMEIECWVLVACPENSLVESKDYYKPIVTPYELELALQESRSWDGRYLLDFEKVLNEFGKDDSINGKEQEREGGGAEDDRDPDKPHFSLVTGTFKHAKRFGGESDLLDPSNSSLVRRENGAVAVLNDSAAGHFLANRSYQGLEVRRGEDDPSVLEQGRSGIARGYEGS